MFAQSMCLLFPCPVDVSFPVLSLRFLPLMLHHCIGARAKLCTACRSGQEIGVTDMFRLLSGSQEHQAADMCHICDGAYPGQDCK